MAINPLLVSIKQASDLTTAIPTAAGYFFYYEDGELRKASMTDIYNKVNGAFGGDLLIVDNPAPTTPTWYFAKESGTYANAGGLVVDTNGKLVILNYDGSNWNMIETAALEGKSTYQVALDNGFVGTEAEWLASLQVHTSGDIVSVNQFNKVNIIPDVFIDASTGAYNAAAGYGYAKVFIDDAKLKAAGGKVTVSGLGNIHYGLGWRFNDINGNLLRRNDAAGDVTSFIADDADFPGVHSFEFTYKTGKPGDNTDADNIQVEYGTTATAYTDYEENVKAINGKVIKGEIEIGTQPNKNIFNPENVTPSTYVNVDTGVVASAGGYDTGFILLDSAKLAAASNKITLSGFGVHHALGWRIEDVGGTLLKYGMLDLDVPSGVVDASGITGAHKLIFTYKTGKGGDVMVAANVQAEYGSVATLFIPYGVEAVSLEGIPIAIPQNSVNAKIAGRKVLVLGDSITAQATGAGGTVVSWVDYANEIWQADTDNYAISGASFTDWVGYTYARQQLSVQITDAIAAGITPDIIIISIATNDYLRFSELGNYDTAMGKATLAALDRSLVLEAARWAFWKCKTQWKDAQCFYANPLQRVVTPSATDNLADENGLWLRKPIEAMARRYNFTVIDQYSKSGIVKDFEVDGANGRFLSDGLHPNTDGKILQGKFMAKEVLKELF